MPTRKRKPKRVERAPRAAKPRPGRPLRIVDARPQAGRPTVYVAEYAHIAGVMCEKLGATDFEIARALSVSLATIYRWKHEHPEFREAIKLGKAVNDERVEAALFHRAIGYSHDATKIVQNGSEVIAVEYVEHYPPDTAAAFIWLKNRKGWRDRQDIVTDPFETKSDVEELSDGDIFKRLELIAQRRQAEAKQLPKAKGKAKK